MLCWISLCWAQINFRKRLLTRGYTVKDLSYVTPGAPYTGFIAIGLMVISLILLLFNNDPTFKIAFFIGAASFIVPTLIYKLFNLAQHRHEVMAREQRIEFEALFPVKDPSPERAQLVEDNVYKEFPI